jgi:hypothetical protein
LRQRVQRLCDLFAEILACHAIHSDLLACCDTAERRSICLSRLVRTDDPNSPSSLGPSLIAFHVAGHPERRTA